VQRINWGITYWAPLGFCSEPATDNREKSRIGFSRDKNFWKIFERTKCGPEGEGREAWNNNAKIAKFWFKKIQNISLCKLNKFFTFAFFAAKAFV